MSLPDEDKIEQPRAAFKVKGEQEVSKSFEFEDSTGSLSVTPEATSSQLVPSERHSYEAPTKFEDYIGATERSSALEGREQSTSSINKRPRIHWAWILFIVGLYTFIFFSSGLSGISLYQNVGSGFVGLATNYVMKAVEVLSLPTVAIIVIVLFEFVAKLLPPAFSLRQSRAQRMTAFKIVSLPLMLLVFFLMLRPLLSQAPQRMENYGHQRTTAELAAVHNLYAQKRYDEAIKIYDRWIIETPHQQQLYDDRGFCYEALQQNHNALKDFDKAIGVAPTALTYSFRGRFYASTGEYQKAIDDFTNSIDLEPSDGNIRRDRARAYKKIGKPDLAQKDIDLADAPYNTSK